MTEYIERQVIITVDMLYLLSVGGYRAILNGCVFAFYF